MDGRDKLMIALQFKKRFEALLDSLCLTDRQKEIARYKYLRGWANEDVAAEIGASRRTVTEEMKIIRQVIGAVDVEKFIAEFDKIDN